MLDYIRRYTSTPNLGLFDSQVPEAIRRSLQRVQLMHDTDRREKLATLHSLLDGAHRDYVHAAAKALYGERAHEWAEGGYAGYRYLPWVKTMCDRLAVAFHTPPELYLHNGDGVPITEGPQAEQLLYDIETGGIDTTLSQVERWVTCMEQCIVWPRFIRHAGYGDGMGCIKWTLVAPYDVWAVPNKYDTADIQQAESVSILLASREVDQVQGAVDTFIHWTREGDINPKWGMYMTENGKLVNNPLFPDTNANGYGMYPFVMWQTNNPVQGELWLPPNEDWIQQHIGICLSLTDLAHGARYQAHGMLVYRGGDTEVDGELVLGPGRVVTLPDPEMQLDWLSPPSGTLASVRHYVDFCLRLSGVAESLDPETFSEGGSTRNLAAMKQRQADKMLRRTAVLPYYRRYLRETWKRHKVVNDHAVSMGWAPNRVEYGELHLGVKFAAIPEVEDRFQGVQASIAEINAGLTTPADVVMRRDGISRAEAERMTDTAATVPNVSPLQASPGGGVPRAPDVRD